ncbi:MAG: PepSY-like domain-containing protein [Marinifilaceae bacterium]|nr:PepSY-like domain-containing protein [Marinifilaceae bacterium]
MKRFLFLMVLCVSLMQVACADSEKAIGVTDLPEKAQQFVKRYFADAKVGYYQKERDGFTVTYKVVFLNGDKLEFDRKGEWKDLECRNVFIPDEVVPAQILKFVRDSYPGARVTHIEKTKRKYEVKLDSGMEIAFDLKFNVMELEHDRD